VALEPAARVAPGVKVRDILRVLDPEPVLSPELLTLGLWIAEYYLAPAGEVFSMMLPLRQETRGVSLVELTEAGKRRLEELSGMLLEEERTGSEARFLRHLAEHPGVSLESLRRRFRPGDEDVVSMALEEGWASVREVERGRGRREVLAVRLSGPVKVPPLKLSPVARRIIQELEQHGGAADHRELLKSTRGGLAHLKKLNEAGLIELAEPTSEAFQSEGDLAAPPELSAPQSTLLEELTRGLERREFGVSLLHGVTGSGKTEVYLRLIARCLEQGRSALMLVPEIGLTPAMQSLFAARFRGNVAVMHSGLSETRRHDDWWRVRQGKTRVVVGTRSAVFAPLEDLGVVIVDEEHDASYKQMETPRYHGRDVAVVRARLAKALVVLGSATPSLESYWNAQEGKYQLLTLKERIGGRPLAAVEIVDMRQEFRVTHSQVPFSRRLKEELDAQLRNKAQTMILLNRRGYSWFLLCRSCGETQRCQNCSISLTYHRREHRLLCHYCGYSAAVPARCPACGSEYLHYVGEGTEKIEQKIAELFPGARVERLDRDVARRASIFQRVLTDFRQGKIDILVGTQLIAKGHDFPGVTLVGVVSADIGLGLPDFRSAERTFQLLTQAAGRAGRGDAAGRVLVQTFYPEHYAIRFAAEQYYEGFYEKEIRFRRMMHYPPCAALANVIAQDTKLERATRTAKIIGDFLNSQANSLSGLKVLGPSPAPLAKIEGRYRVQFLIKSNSRGQLNGLLRRLVDHLELQGLTPRAYMIDMDPVSIM
jgi:primosomal protein N' (replication factor Y)